MNDTINNPLFYIITVSPLQQVYLCDYCGRHYNYFFAKYKS